MAGEPAGAVAVLLVLGSSGEAAMEAERYLSRRLREAVSSLLARQKCDAAQLLQRIVLRTAHWEPSWAAARRESGTDGLALASDPVRNSIAQALAFISGYTGAVRGPSASAHQVLAQTLADLAKLAGGTAPLVIVAQGSGALLAELHVSLLQYADAPDCPAELQGSTPLERADTVLALWSLGSPLPLWHCSRGARRCAPWELTVAAVPAPATRGPGASPVQHALARLGGRWNMWHPSDPVGYPIGSIIPAWKPSSPAPKAEVTALPPQLLELPVKLGVVASSGAACRCPLPLEYISRGAKKEVIQPLARHIAQLLLLLHQSQQLLSPGAMPVAADGAAASDAGRAFSSHRLSPLQSPPTDPVSPPNSAPSMMRRSSSDTQGSSKAKGGGLFAGFSPLGYRGANADTGSPRLSGSAPPSRLSERFGWMRLSDPEPLVDAHPSAAAVKASSSSAGAPGCVSAQAVLGMPHYCREECASAAQLAPCSEGGRQLGSGQSEVADGAAEPTRPSQTLSDAHWADSPPQHELRLSREISTGTGDDEADRFASLPASSAENERTCLLPSHASSGSGSASCDCRHLCG